MGDVYKQLLWFHMIWIDLIQIRCAKRIIPGCAVPLLGPKHEQADVHHKWHITVHMLDGILTKGTKVQGNRYMRERRRRQELSSMQQVVAISYWCFSTTYQSHLQGETPEDGTDRLSQNVSKKLQLLSCAITQNSTVLIYFAAEACNHARRRQFSKT
jgi:hypothetical protein